MGSDNKPDKPDGMPEIAPEDIPSGTKQVTVLTLGTFVPLAIGFGIAYAIQLFSSNSALYAKNAAFLFRSIPDVHYVFAALVVLGRTLTFVNMYPAICWKTQVMRTMSGNLRANMFVYELVGQDAAKVPNSKVVMAEEGALGAYNRANRSMTHMVENFGFILASVFLCGAVFPFPTLVCVSLWCAGRVMHQVGYTKGYGTHGAGFGLSMLSAVTMEGMCLWVFCKGAGIVA